MSFRSSYSQVTITFQRLWFLDPEKALDCELHWAICLIVNVIVSGSSSISETDSARCGPDSYQMDDLWKKGCMAVQCQKLIAMYPGPPDRLVFRVEDQYRHQTIRTLYTTIRE